MIFRRRRSQPIEWPAQSIARQLAAGVLQLAGRLAQPMTRWSRLQRASIVFVGLPIAVALVWLGYTGWGFGIGAVSIVLFWLAALPVEFPPVPDDSADQPPTPGARED